MDSRTITIVSVNYNGFEYTCQMIDSLIEYETYPFELIVVDNGSREDEASRLKSAYDWVTVIRSEKNLGFAGGNNLGIEASDADYVLLLNNDTVIRSPFLETMVSTFSQYPEVGVVSPKILFENSDRVVQYAGFTDLTPVTLRNHSVGYGCEDSREFGSVEFTFYAHGAAMMVSREVIDRVGLMPECYFLYYEELDWCESIRRAGYTIVYQPRAEVFHKESMATGKISGLKSYYQVRNRLFFARRNRHAFQKIMSVAYQLSVSVPKTLLGSVVNRDMKVVKSICKGALDGVFKQCLVLLCLMIFVCGCGGDSIKTHEKEVRAYAKDHFGFSDIPMDSKEEFVVTITIPHSMDSLPEYNVEIPDLKYGKSFAYTFTGDDTYASIYRKALMMSLGRQSLRLNKQLDDLSNVVLGDGFAYGDSFGRKHPFKFGISAQVFHKYGVVTPYFSRYNAFKNEYITWDELNSFYDYGCGVYNHGGGLMVELLGLNGMSLGISQNVFETHLGVRPKIMVRPDGDDRYITVARQMPDFVMCTTEGDSFNMYPKLINLKDSSLNLNAKVQNRTCLDGMSFDTLTARIDSLASMSDDTHGYWIHDFVHSIGDDNVQSINKTLVEQYLNYIKNRYGVEGADNVWFASMDEIYEYWYVKSHLKISVENSDSACIFTVKGSIPVHFRWKEFSFRIKPSRKISGLTSEIVLINGATNFLCSVSDDGIDVWVNVSNRDLLTACKYLMYLDQNFTTYNLHNAEYFIDALPDNQKNKLHAELLRIKTKNNIK